MAAAVIAMIGWARASAHFPRRGFSRGLKAIHFRHLAIMENHVVRAALPGGHRLQPVADDLNFTVQFAQLVGTTIWFTGYPPPKNPPSTGPLPAVFVPVRQPDWAC